MFLTVNDKWKLLKAVANNLWGTLRPGRNVSPPAIVWLPTYKCNAACHHCDFWQRDPTVNEDSIRTIAQKIAKSDAVIVNLSGGEVFLVPNIKEVIELLKRSGKYVRINSNGLIIGDYLDFLLKVGVDSIVFSLDSSHSEQHDANRGKEGAFDRCLRAIDYIRSHRTGKKPEISVRCILMKDNIDQIDDFIRFFSSRVDRIEFQPIHDKTEKHKVVNSSVLFDPKDEPLVREAIARAASKHRFLDQAYFLGFPDFIFHPERLCEAAANSCLPVLFNTLVINPDGECRVCTSPIGNILEKELPTIWGGPSRMDFLNDLATKGSCSTPCWLNSSSAKASVAGSVAKAFIKQSQRRPAAKE